MFPLLNRLEYLLMKIYGGKHTLINYLKGRASGVEAIKRIRPFVPPPTLRYIYNALIQSHFDYCYPVGGNCCKTLFDRLQNLQNQRRLDTCHMTIFYQSGSSVIMLMADPGSFPKARVGAIIYGFCSTK